MLIKQGIVPAGDAGKLSRALLELWPQPRKAGFFGTFGDVARFVGAKHGPDEDLHKLSEGS